MHKKPFCQLKFSMPHLTAACFGKSEQKSVHPFVSFGKVGVRRGTSVSVVRKKDPISLNSCFLEGCVLVYLEIPTSVYVGNRYLCFDVDFAQWLYVNVVNISKQCLKLPVMT